LRMLRGTARIDADIVAKPELQTGPPPTDPSNPPDEVWDWDYDLRCHLTEGEFNHAQLPWPLTGLDATVHCVNGKVPLFSLRSTADGAPLHVTAKDIDSTKATDPLVLEDYIRELDVDVKSLTVTPKVIKALAKEPRSVCRLFQPEGLADVRFTITHD